jgi:hypothetical protein
MELCHAMSISQKRLRALQAIIILARHFDRSSIRLRHIAFLKVLFQQFRELTLLNLEVHVFNNARGYQLRAVCIWKFISASCAIAGPSPTFGHVPLARFQLT